MKQRELLCAIRASIGAGALGPGQQLPTRQEFKARHTVSGITIDRVISKLSREGFVRCVPGDAVYVSIRPPNITRFGLVFPWRPTSNLPWSLHWKSLTAAALEIEKTDGIEIPVFYDIEHSAHDTREFDRLVKAVESDQIAGLIFGESPHSLAGTPVLNHPGMPRVAIMGEPNMPGISVCRYDGCGYLHSAFGHFAKAGHKKLAVLLANTLDGMNDIDSLRSKAGEFGLDLPDWRIQSVHPDAPSWAAHVMEMLFRAAPEDRPDALLIQDDNLVEYAQRGLVAAGVGSKYVVDIIAHCNWPTPPSQVLPMTLLGFDSSQVLRQCIHLIRQQRRTGGSVQLAESPAVFEPSQDYLPSEVFSADVSSSSAVALEV